MANIALFAETGISVIPATVVQWLSQYNEQGHRFIVADTTGGDERFHKELSAVGAAENSCIYCMDKPKNNKFELPVKSFITSFDEGASSFTISADDNSIEPRTYTGVHKIEDIALNSSWYEFRDMQIVRDSDMVIILTVSNELPKRFRKLIQYINLIGKALHIVNTV